MSNVGRSEIEKYVHKDITKFRNNAISFTGTILFIAVAIQLNPLVFIFLSAGLGAFVLLKLALPEENSKKKIRIHLHREWIKEAKL
jgi:hypothetical protein